MYIAYLMVDSNGCYFEDDSSVMNKVIALTLLLLISNLVNMKWWQKSEKSLKPWKMGNHLIVLSESFQMNAHRTKMIFLIFLLFCAFDESNLSSRRVKCNVKFCILLVFLPHFPSWQMMKMHRTIKWNIQILCVDGLVFSHGMIRFF